MIAKAGIGSSEPTRLWNVWNINNVHSSLLSRIWRRMAVGIARLDRSVSLPSLLKQPLQFHAIDRTSDIVLEQVRAGFQANQMSARLPVGHQQRLRRRPEMREELPRRNPPPGGSRQSSDASFYQEPCLPPSYIRSNDHANPRGTVPKQDKQMISILTVIMPPESACYRR